MTSTLTFNTTTAVPTNINGSPIHSLNPAEKRPNTFNLVHVRLPPGFTPSSTQGPMEVHAALHNSGTLLLAASTGDDDTLWCVSGDSFPSENLLSEAQVSVPIDGRAWVIREVPEPPSPLQVACLPPGASIPPDPPIQVIQHFQRPSEYVVVTSQGCYMFNRLRPVDQLRFLLEMTHDPEGESVANFFKLYKNGEAACTCIILAASGLPGDRVVSEKAVAAFFRHGGEPYYTQQASGSAPATLGQNPTNSPMSNVGSPLSPIGAGPRQIDTTVLRTPGGLPVISTPMPGASAPAFQLSSPGPGTNFHVPASSAQAPATPELCYSDKMKGLFKMFSRIVRPLWEGNLVSEYAVVQDNRQQILNVSRIDLEVVSHVLEDLNSLKLFMETQVIPRLPLVGIDSGYRGSSLSMTQHRLDVSGLHGTVLRQSSIRAQQAQAALAEAKMTQALYNLLEHTTQVIGLWRFICNHDIHLLCQCLPKEVLSVLKTMVFHDFVLDGQQVCSQLISVIVNQYIDNKSEVEGLNKKLRQICPSLYSLDDVICSRASELLSSARLSTGEVHKMELKESLELFQQVAHCVNLPLVSQQYQAVGFYEGVVELCATAAIKKDPRNLALQYYKSTASPAENIEGSNAYHIRAECYKSVTDMMDALMQASESLPQAPSVPVELGPPKPTSMGTTKSTQNLKPEEAQRYAESCLQLALHSEDELFHEAIYDWMLRRNLKDKLLRISSPFLEMYLKRITASRPDDPFSCDILWQYYERSGDHLAAAKILSTLADKAGNDRDLTRRIEYLSRSKMNGKSATTGRAGGEGGQLLHELEEKLEVAQLQSQIQQALKDNREDEAANSLNFQLMDITKLYSEYAEPFELAECKLAIVHCAGHYDPPLIDALWQNVIEQEFSRLQNQSPENQVGTLSVKITQLGQRYSNAQRYFPVEFLIKFLERLTCEQGWPDHWVFSSLLNAGVQITHLLDAYQDLHRQKLTDWEHLGSSYHLLRVIHKIIGAFAENPANYIAASQRRQFISYALDIIAALLVELQSTVEVTDQLLDTRTRFKNLQSQMERLQSQAAVKY